MFADDVSALVFHGDVDVLEHVVLMYWCDGFNMLMLLVLMRGGILIGQGVKLK